MASQLQLRRGNTASVAALTGAQGELIVDTTTNLVYLQDGSTPGGHLVGNPGSVTTVSVTTANGVSGSVANATTTPAITLTLDAITPTSVASVGSVTGSNLSGTNTGDQTITLTGGVTGSGTGSFAATVVTNANLTGDVTSVGNATTYTTVPATKGGTAQTTYTTGDILYASASNTLSKLAVGTAGQVLTVAGGVPTWSNTPTLTGTNFTGIPNAGLTNSSLTVNGTSIALGASGTVTAAAGTLTGATLAAGVTASSLTSVGTLTSLAVTGTITTNSLVVGYLEVVQRVTGTTTLVLADSGKHIYTASGGQTYTIPANSSVAYPIGTVITFVNQSLSACTIAITTDTMFLSNSAGSAGSRTLGQYGVATALKIAATTWIISGSGIT